MNILYVFTTHRRIRAFNESYQNALVPKAFSVDEFKQRASIVKDRVSADETQLLLLMRQACKMSQNAQKKLNIPTEFFSFLKNSDYLFSFFKELATQEKCIEDIKFSDIYANFEEHLNILSEVLKNYKALLKSHGLYDEITFCELYEINDEFLRAFDEIRVEIFGILSAHEWEFFKKCAKIVPIKMQFQTSKFNSKFFSFIEQMTGKALALYHKFELNLSTLELSDLGEIRQNRLVLTRAFKNRALAAAYVFEKISHFMSEGIRADEIAVILPDEEFAQILRLFDDKNMLSYAMGSPFFQSKFYAILKVLNEAVKENLELKFGENALNSSDLSEAQTFLNLANLNNELWDKFKNYYDFNVEFSQFEALMREILALCAQTQTAEILNEELYFLSKISKNERLKFSELVQILLIRLNVRNFDEAHGGMVRAVGVLESRALSFKGVIIVDFNDDVVPKRSVNEMFLSSKVREKAGLISYYERENLQRFFYENLINSAKIAAICYVLDDDKIASRFLSEFDCVNDTNFSDDEYLGVFSGGVEAKFKEVDIKLNHDFFAKPLSFSRLNTFLTCPRKYYYLYIKNIKEGRNLGTKSASEYGKIIHESLHEYYLNFKIFKLDEFLKILKPKGLSALEFKIAQIKFKDFEREINKHADEGWVVSELECEKSAVFDGVNISGIIDRIDARADELFVIDYKTGKIPTDTLQLAFYQALLNKNAKAHFCDLKDKMAIDFSKTGDLDELKSALNLAKEYFNGEVKFEQKRGSACKNCAFVALCLGEIR